MFFIVPFCSTRRKATKALNNSSNVIPPRLLERRHIFHTVFSINLMTHTWSPEVLESRTSGIVCLQSPSCRVPRRRRLKDAMGSGDENGVLGRGGGKLLLIHSLKWNRNDVLTTCKAISLEIVSGLHHCAWAYSSCRPPCFPTETEKNGSRGAKV